MRPLSFVLVQRDERVRLLIVVLLGAMVDGYVCFFEM